MKVFVAAGIALGATICVAAAQSLGTWSERARLPIARSEVSVAQLDAQVYVLGGYANGNVDQPIVERYDTRTNTWSERAPLPRGLNHIATVGFNEKVYTFGGFVAQNREAIPDCNVYDPVTNAWHPIAPLPRKRGSISVAVLDGKIHLVGGRDTVSVTEHDVYEPATDRWTSAAPLPDGEGRDHMGLVAAGGKLYAIGGRFNDFNHNTDLAEVYDPATDRWSELPRLPTARSGGAAGVLGGRILYIGGEHGGGTFTENEAFDPATSRWSTLAPLPFGRHGTGAAVIDDRLYLPAGAPVNGGSQQSDTLYVFSLR